jgi:serine/threonine-protein kinase
VTDRTTSSGHPASATEIRAFRSVGSGDRLGRYELSRELGQGGMASVFLGRDTELRRDVALKVLHSHLARRAEIVARFSREARSVAGIDHRHILRILDVGNAGAPDADGIADPPFIVMELVDGANLREFLLDNGAPLGEVVGFIGIAMCSALSAAHARGIVHRDVKPANIMIASDGRLVLSDFGVAHIADSDTVVTQTGAVLGTPAFMSPEQAMGNPIDARSDVYSLGASLYRLATGKLPFTGPTPKVIAAIAQGDYTPPLRQNPAMGAELARVIETMMQTAPADRYATADDARAALEGAVAAAGLGDADDELREYFKGPGEYNATRTGLIVTATLAAARTAVEQNAIPRALGLADRVLALSPEHPEALELVDTIGTTGETGARRTWIAAAAVVVAGGVLAGWLWPRDEPVATSAPDAGAVDAGVADANAVGPADAALAVVPLDLPDAGERKVVRVRTPRRRPDAAPIPAAAAKPDAAPAPVSPAKPGTVSFAMSAWCDVYIDGVRHGRAKRGARIEVEPGEHVFECSQGAGAPTFTETRTVAAGEHVALKGALIEAIAVTVDVSGDAVRIRGKRYADGATLKLHPGNHVVEVLAGHEVTAVQLVRFRSGRPCTLRDSPKLACRK